LVVIEITASTYDVDRMAPGRIAAFAPPLALMGLIYFLSAQPDLNSGLGLVDEIGRKLVHMAEYGLLWWLWCRALGFRRPVLAAVITLAYAATDEFHQTFVHGRVGSPIDWLIDGAGVAVAWALTTAWARRRVASR
jgi:VanZ family protein